MATKLSAEDGTLGVSKIFGTRKNSYVDIDLSFAAKPSGEIYKKNESAAVKQAVKNLISTNYNEKPFKPRFGGNIRDLLFDLADEFTESDAISRIKFAIGSYEPRAEVVDVVAKSIPERNQLGISVTFKVINTNEIITLTSTLARLR
jgi:phage baseplate assembly protein W|tara:strand:- start:1193 stop:1633 length:441 start_codon:yes stop_codon:yes gene_type:complete